MTTPHDDEKLSKSIAAQREMSDDDLKALKDRRDELMREAERAAYKYFCECEVGPEREKAHDIYTNIRTAKCVY